MKTILFFTLATLFSLFAWFVLPASQAKTNPHDMHAFSKFLRDESVSYSSVEERAYRFSVFQSNLRLIQSTNSQNLPYKLGVNRLADRTKDELFSQYLPPFPEEARSLCQGEETPSPVPPRPSDIRKIDWVDLGHVTAVKNQGNCGACYAFGSIAAIESALSVAGQGLTSLSEQQIIDCSRDYHNLGCGGGLISQSFHYAMEHTLTTESDYPYQGKTTTCNEGKGKQVVQLDSCRKIGLTTTDLTNEIVKRPVAVAFDAELDIFFYKFGVYNPRSCGEQVNHAVLAVGFDLDYSTPYYRIKNSWGTWWGKSGYLYMAIGKDPKGTCNVAGSGHNFVPNLKAK